LFQKHLKKVKNHNKQKLTEPTKNDKYPLLVIFCLPYCTDKMLYCLHFANSDRHLIN